MRDYHEIPQELTNEQRDIVRALASFREEVEAVDWYFQRVCVAESEELKEIMWHNAVEEMEHAIMSLEWLRRNQEGWDEQMRTYLFTEENILEVEESGEGNGGEKKSSSLGIGELK